MTNVGHAVIPEPVTNAPGTIGQLAGEQRVVITEDGEVIITEVQTTLAFADDRELWERQPGESDRHWEAFQCYLHSRPAERRYTIIARKLAARHEEEGYLGRPSPRYALMGQWARQNRWEERTLAFDNYVAQKETDALIAHRIQARIDASNLAQELKKKALAAVQALKAIVTETKKQEDGTTKVIVRSALTPNEIAKLADLGIRLERQALDMDNANPDGTTKETEAPITANVTVNLFNRESEEALLQRAQQILEAREMQRRTVDSIALLNATEAEELAGSDETDAPKKPQLAAGSGGVRR